MALAEVSFEQYPMLEILPGLAKFFSSSVHFCVDWIYKQFFDFS